jgi:protein-L-isoaspartate O-methyltransferase
MLPAQLGELQPTPNPGLAFFYASASMLVEDLRSSFEFGMGTSYQSTLCAKLHPGATMYGTEIESSLTDFMRRILDEEVLGLEDVKDRTEVFSDDSLFYFREKGPFDFIPFAFTVPNDVNLESVAEQSLREGGVLLAPQQYEKDGALTQPHEGMFRLYRKSEGVIEMAEVLDCSFTPAVDYAGPYGA